MRTTIIPLNSAKDDYGVYGPQPTILFRGTLDECIAWRRR